MQWKKRSGRMIIMSVCVCIRGMKWMVSFRGKLLSIFRFEFWFPKYSYSHMLFGIITMAKLICVISEREKKMKNSFFYFFFLRTQMNLCVGVPSRDGILKLKMHRWVMSEQFALHVFACVRCMFHIFCSSIFVMILFFTLSIYLSLYHTHSVKPTFFLVAFSESVSVSLSLIEKYSNEMTCIRDTCKRRAAQST